MDVKSFRALDLIYDTAVAPGRWRRALDAVGDAVDARAVALVIRGRRAGAPDLTMMSRVYLDFSRTPAGLFYGASLSPLQEDDWAVLQGRPLMQGAIMRFCAGASGSDGGWGFG
ncbi:MAG: hypothetical protein OIF47_14975 [Marinibacterium sp.]|nr:hypothetical protein [Marinibacterium sp.]